MCNKKAVGVDLALQEIIGKKEVRTIHLTKKFLADWAEKAHAIGGALSVERIHKALSNFQVTMSHCGRQYADDSGWKQLKYTLA